VEVIGWTSFGVLLVEKEARILSLGFS